MSRTHLNRKGPGFEYWASRLHPGGEDPGRWTKTQTHRKERRDAKEQIKVEVREDEDACMADIAEANAFLDAVLGDDLGEDGDACMADIAEANGFLDAALGDDLGESVCFGETCDLCGEI